MSFFASPKILLCLALTALFWPEDVRGDEVLRQVQEELRKRKVYFGDIDGRETRELRAALSHYQETRGLQATGRLSEETLDTLDIAVPVGELTFPEGVVLRSDPGPGEEAEAMPPEIETIPESTPLPEPTPPPAAKETASRAELTEFVEQYLADSASPALEAELAHYAPVVDYFDHGIRPLSFIKKDVKNYRKRWPGRQYELTDSVTVEPTAEGIYQVTFVIAFDVTRAADQAKGRARETFTIDTSSPKWMITRMKEERIRL